MKRTLDYPPVWLALFMGLAWGISLFHAPLGGMLVGTGAFLIAGGVALAIWAALAFRRARTTIVPHENPSALVDTGPYRFSRNPIYLADLLILGGWCLCLGAPVALVLLIPFQVVLTLRFIRPEEARLATHLGPAYAAYRARVRRWI